MATPIVTLQGGEEPIYTRLYKAIRDQIVHRRWPAGMRLPSTRLLAADLGIARGTASVAIDQLVSEGWLVSEVRSGVFVADRTCPELPPHPEPGGRESALLLAANFRDLTTPTELFPIARWRQHQTKVWGRSEVHELLMAEQAGGHPELRSALATLLCGSRGVIASAEQVMVCSGRHAAVEVVLRAHLPPRSLVAMETPGDPLLADRLRRSGFLVAGVAVDDDGLTVDALPSQAAAVICAPVLQYPSGTTMGEGRRHELLAWASEAEALILELDCDGHLARKNGKPVSPLSFGKPSDRIIYVRDLDRVTYPGLNIAFAVLPNGLDDHVRDLRQVVDRPLPVCDQLVLADFIKSGALAAHLRKASSCLLRGRQALLELLAGQLGSYFIAVHAVGGLIRISTRPEQRDALIRHLRVAGLAARCASEFHIGDSPISPDIVLAVPTLRTVSKGAGGLEIDRTLASAASH
jgi:GntR family transcriptional regulator/MocR family aminotransferase